jgi:CRP-like cAMP-binding protein
MATDWHLCKDDFFYGLSDEKKSFMSLAKRREFVKNSIAFFEDDVSQSCFYVESGIIEIFKTTIEGKEPIFFLRRQGEFFGLSEAIDGKTRKANARAIAPSVLWEISRENLEYLLTENPKFTQKIIQILGRRIRYLGQLIENLISCTVINRLAKLLVYLCYDDLADQNSWERPVKVPVNLTQNQLASMTGSCQQTISDTLKCFQANGLINVCNKEITILNPLKLLSYATH